MPGDVVHMDFGGSATTPTERSVDVAPAQQAFHDLNDVREGQPIVEDFSGGQADDEEGTPSTPATTTPDADDPWVGLGPDKAPDAAAAGDGAAPPAGFVPVAQVMDLVERAVQSRLAQFQQSVQAPPPPPPPVKTYEEVAGARPDATVDPYGAQLWDARKETYDLAQNVRGFKDHIAEQRKAYDEWQREQHYQGLKSTVEQGVGNALKDAAGDVYETIPVPVRSRVEGFLKGLAAAMVSANPKISAQQVGQEVRWLLSAVGGLEKAKLKAARQGIQGKVQAAAMSVPAGAGGAGSAPTRAKETLEQTWDRVYGPRAAG